MEQCVIDFLINNFIRNVKNDVGYEFNAKDIEYSFGDNSYVRMKGGIFSDMLNEVVKRELTEEEKKYLSALWIKLRYVGIGEVVFAMNSVVDTEFDAVYISFTKDCPYDIKERITEKIRNVFYSVMGNLKVLYYKMH